MVVLHFPFFALKTPHSLFLNHGILTVAVQAWQHCRELEKQLGFRCFLRGVVGERNIFQEGLVKRPHSIGIEHLEVAQVVVQALQMTSLYRVNNNY